MANTIVAQIDAGWSLSTLTYVFTRVGTQLGTSSSTIAQVASGLWKATSTAVNMAGYGAGTVEISLIDPSYNLAWVGEIDIDAAGDPVNPSMGDPWNTSIPGAYGAGTAGYILGETILSKTSLIGTGAAFATAPVSVTGDLEVLVIDDDYLAANGRALEWTFDSIPGFAAGTATGKFGIINPANASEFYVNSSGVTSDLGGGVWKVSFDIPKAALTGFTETDYNWSVEIVQAAVEITIIKNHQHRTRVRVEKKQT